MRHHFKNIDLQNKLLSSIHTQIVKPKNLSLQKQQSNLEGVGLYE